MLEVQAVRVGTVSRIFLQWHFDRENARVEELMKKRVTGFGEQLIMDNGQVIEKETKKNMISYLKDFKDMEFMSDDAGVSILYNDGEIVTYVGGDDTTKMKLTNIKGVIIDGPNSTAFAGDGVIIENWNETQAYEKLKRRGEDLRYAYKNYGKSKEFDDWRVDFE